MMGNKPAITPYWVVTLWRDTLGFSARGCGKSRRQLSESGVQSLTRLRTASRSLRFPKPQSYHVLSALAAFLCRRHSAAMMMRPATSPGTSWVKASHTPLASQGSRRRLAGWQVNMQFIGHVCARKQATGIDS